MEKEFNAYFEATVMYDDELHLECGFIPVDSFTEAMRIVEDHFGNQLCAVKFDWMDPGLITMPKEVAKQVREFNGADAEV